MKFTDNKPERGGEALNHTVCVVDRDNRQECECDSCFEKGTVLRVMIIGNELIELRRRLVYPNILANYCAKCVNCSESQAMKIKSFLTKFELNSLDLTGFSIKNLPIDQRNY